MPVSAVSAPVRCRPTPADADLQFPGCRPVRLRRDDLADFDGRLEYWDARTETGWMERGIAVAASFTARAAAAVDTPRGARMAAAALACTAEEDFWRRLDQP